MKIVGKIGLVNPISAVVKAICAFGIGLSVMVTDNVPMEQMKT